LTTDYTDERVLTTKVAKYTKKRGFGVQARRQHSTGKKQIFNYETPRVARTLCRAQREIYKKGTRQKQLATGKINGILNARHAAGTPEGTPQSGFISCKQRRT
jgi:hypothetical protein